jgi:hypothetical protein
MSSTSSSIVTPLDSVSSSVFAVAPELVSVVGTAVVGMAVDGMAVDGADDVVLGVALSDDDSELDVFDDVVFEDVVLDEVVLDDVVAAAPAAAVPVTPDAHAVSDTTDNNEIPAMAALMDDRMMHFSQ